MNSYYFGIEGRVVSLSPLQVSEGAADGLTKLTEAEEKSHLNPVPTRTVESLKEAVSKKKWEVETGGITLPNGVKVATALDDQNRITTVVANVRLANLETFKFKAQTGWVPLTLDEVESIAAAVAMHVQSCFAAECLHHEAIGALSKQHSADPNALQRALDDYDETVGWPE